MKKTGIILTMLFVIGLIAGCAQKADLPKLTADAIPPAGSSSSFESLVLDSHAKVAKELDEVMVYTCMPVQVSKAQTDGIAKTMGLVVEKQEDREGYSIFADGKGNAIIVYRASGSISCNLDALDRSTAEFKGELLSEEEYKHIALQWIKDAGLFSDELSEVASVYENGFIEATKDGKEYTYPTEMTVVFYHKPLEGIEVSGVAPRIVVSLDLEGRIMSVQKIQRAFKSLQRYPIKPATQAVEDILFGKGTVYGPGSAKLNGRIMEVNIVYYNHDAMTAQQTLLPVYVFKGTCEDGEFTAVVHAVEANYLSDEAVSNP